MDLHTSDPALAIKCLSATCEVLKKEGGFLMDRILVTVVLVRRLGPADQFCPEDSLSRW